jgi:hypothetical protein
MASLDIISWFWQHSFPVVVISILYVFLQSWLKPGLRSIPGPWLAKFSNIWRFYDVAKGRPDITLYKLHQKHGDYVRLGPRVVSVKNIEVLKTIYGISAGYGKVGTNPSFLACLEADTDCRVRSTEYNNNWLMESQPSLCSHPWMRTSMRGSRNPSPRLTP